MTQSMVSIPAAVMLVLMVAIYGAIIAGLACLIRRWQVIHQYAVILSFLIFGVVSGILIVWLWPLDSSVLPNIFGVWLGDWLYHQAIAWVDDPNSAQAHNTIPWFFQIPQVYAIASTGLCVMAGWVLQWINRRRTRVRHAGVRRKAMPNIVRLIIGLIWSSWVSRRHWRCMLRARFFLVLLLLSFVLAACDNLSPNPSPQSPSPPPHTDGLTEQEAATLSSLKKVDEHPLYTMRYFGAYETRQSYASIIASPYNPLRAIPRPTWGCSLFAALGDANNMLYGRNFDWEPSPAVLFFTEPANGYASVSMVDIAYLGFSGNHAQNIADLPLAERRALLRAPSLPFDGMNSRGLAIGMAAVPDGQMKNDPSRPTIDSLMVIRKILDSAATVDEAVAIFQQYNINWGGGPPLHYLVADQTGRSVLIEFYQGTRRIIPNAAPWHQATNFLQSSVANPAGQCWRRDTIAQRLGSSNGRTNPGEAMQLLSDVWQNHTQWSIVYEMHTGKVNVTMGRHYDRTHSFELRLTGQTNR